MLILQNNRNKTFPQPSSNNEDLDFNIFKQALYKNCKVYRLIIHDYPKQSVLNISSWYTISLKLVTEFGLPAQTTLFTSSQILPISCQLLVLNNSEQVSYYTSPSNLKIEYRLYEENDAWKTLDDVKSLALNNIITLQYRIIATDHKIPRDLFIRFQPVTLDNNTPLGLCLGPFSLTNTHTTPVQSPMMWGSSNKNTLSLYRVLPLPKPNAQCLFKEVWDNGTSGKLWDSALIMNKVFSMLIKYDKNCLSKLRILDLSAGIGCVGLSIESTCRMYKTDHPPEIVLTDLEEALPLMKCNQRLNRIPRSKRLAFKTLRWGSRKDILNVCKKSFDYILVLDVLYNTSDFPALIDTFNQLAERNPNATIIMGYKPRGLEQSEENMFFNECRLHLNIEQLNLESLCREFSKTCHIDQSNVLENTAVNFYRITKK